MENQRLKYERLKSYCTECGSEDNNKFDFQAGQFICSACGELFGDKELYDTLLEGLIDQDKPVSKELIVKCTLCVLICLLALGIYLANAKPYNEQAHNYLKSGMPSPWDKLLGPTEITITIAVESNDLGLGRQRVAYKLEVIEDGQTVELLDEKGLPVSGEKRKFFSYFLFSRRNLNFNFDFKAFTAYLLTVTINDEIILETPLYGWREE